MPRPDRAIRPPQPSSPQDQASPAALSSPGCRCPLAQSQLQRGLVASADGDKPNPAQTRLQEEQYEITVPTVTDRVVQAALKLVLEPIFEADFQPCSYGFRPNRRAHDAIAEIHHYATHGYEWVLEADIRACFDEIGHVPLMDRLRARITDKRVCALVKAFLKAGVMTADGDLEESHTGAPQGGILSPLLANIALSALDEQFTRQWQAQMGTHVQRAKRRRNGLGNWRLIRYADDFIVMVSGERRHAEALREEAAAALAPLGLRLAEEKTRVV